MQWHVPGEDFYFYRDSTLDAMSAGAVLAVALMAAPSSRALVLPSVLADDMVLAAAPRQAVLWGTATPGVDVTVVFSGA